MIRRVHTTWAVLTSVAVALTGCHPAQPLFVNEDGDLSHYVDVATDIEYPDAKTTTLSEVENASAPLTLENTQPREMWDLHLEDAVKLSLANSKVMRSLGGRFASSAFNNRAQTGEAPDAILTSPDASRSVYDPAIVESTPFTGTEAALAAFDTQFSSNIFWQHNDRQQDVRANAFGGFFRPFFVQENSTFNAQLAKTTATGGQFIVRNNTLYDANNNPTRQLYSDWNTNLEFTANQPLLAGAGVQYNRIAGPFSPFTTGNFNQTQQFDGVMLARINTDISLADFEGGVRNLVSDVENAYWELYFAYRNLEASKTGRASALGTWKKIHALYVVGAKGGEAEKEAQSREQYFLFRGQVQTALNDLYRAENRLRYVMGLSVSDGRLIRPADEPTTAKVTFDWCDIHAEGLARSVELRRQKWRLKERELELIAARNLVQPRLDATGTYRFTGLGDDLLDPTRNPNTGSANLSGTSAFGNLTSGKFQEWQVGLQLIVPLGFRRELSQVRHYQLQLAKERARLQDQELEVSHEIGDALRNLEYNYALAQTNFNRRVAAERQVEAVEAAFLAETVTLDLLLEAQRRRADAEIAYYRTLSDYNRAIIQVHLRKNSLLEYNGVYLTEGPWPAKAQFDAHRLARQRDASYYLDYGFTRPNVISQGAYQQNTRENDRNGESFNVEGLPQDGKSEEIKTPKPAPAKEKEGDADGGAMADSDSAPRQLRKPAKPRIDHYGDLGLGSSSGADSASRESKPDIGPSEAGEAIGPVLHPSSMGPALQAGSDRARSVIRKSRAVLKQPDTAPSEDKADSAGDSAGGAKPAHFVEWKSTSPHESDANQPAGAAPGTASGWKGTKR